MFGASPAFFFSLYSPEFTVRQCQTGLQLLKDEGFEGYQLEIFFPERVEEWLREAEGLQSRAADLGMTATQFVAHFLMPTTANAGALESDFGFEQMKNVARIVSVFPTCNVITLPCAPFDFEGKRVSCKETAALGKQLVRKLKEYGSIASSVGCSLALELIPGCLADSTDRLAGIIEETGIENLGLNFDTGHAMRRGEPLSDIPAKLAGKIFGTHLKDSVGSGTAALPPGDGEIDWKTLLSALQANGYEGSYDLEIVTSSPQDVLPAYRKGLDCLKSAMS
jgi:sugar phosphate isomerase/epimerase